MLTHGQVCYLQIPSRDTRRSASFYAEVFGWDVSSHAPDFTSPGLIGQWTTDRAPARDAGPLFWIHVDDLAGARRLARENGGEVVLPPTPDGTERTLATVTDPDSNLIGLAASA